MITTIVDDPAFKLEVSATRHPYGTTLFLVTTWPKAVKPEPHTHFSVTLSQDELIRLRNAIADLIG